MDRFKRSNLFSFFAILQRFKPLFYTFILHLAQSLHSKAFGGGTGGVSPGGVSARRALEMPYP